MKSVTVVYDGHTLNDLFTVVDVARPLMGAPTPATVEVQGRDGVVFTGTTLSSYTVSVTLVALGETAEGMREAMRRLASWLAVDEPCALSFSDEPALYRLAIPSDVGDLETLGVVNGQAEVTFTVCDPWLYGQTQAFASTGGVATFTVGGTLPTPVKLTCPAASGTYTVTDESGNYSSVAVGSTAKALAIDAGQGTVTVGGAASIMTLQSDWLILDPGTHTLKRTSGSGEFMAAYTERWAG